MINIAVSACLLGQKVRYDGKHKCANLTQYFDPEIYQLISICPEVEMGLSIPRPSIQMRIINDDTRLVQVNKHNLDYTEQLNSWYCLNKQKLQNINGFVLKSKSPSCGNHTTRLYQTDDSFSLDDGLFVINLKKHNAKLPIIDENALTNDQLTQFKFEVEKIASHAK